MKNLEQHVEQLNKQHQERIEIAKNDYEKGRIDCRAGVYDSSTATIEPTTDKLTI